MGRGKTSWAIQEMKNNSQKRYIYITPYCDEITRVINQCNCISFKEPKKNKADRGTKFNHLKSLLKRRENIATTHALFKFANCEIKNLIEQGNYTLIMDEVCEVVSKYSGLTNKDFDLLLKNNNIYVDNKGFVCWNEDKLDYEGKFDVIKTMCLNRNLIVYGKNKNMLIWNFPCEILNAFEDVFILTYIFEGQLQKYYFQLNNIRYEYYNVFKNKDRYYIAPMTDNKEDLEFIRNAKKMTNIHQGRLNNIGTPYKGNNPLCKNWYKKAKPEQLELLKKNIYNYYTNIVNGKTDNILWTTFKDYRFKVRGKGFYKDESFLACNTRATNKFKHTYNLVYAINFFPDTVIINYFKQNGIEVNVDAISITSMLQWIWRSRIREGLPINIYIPSQRMRNLFNNWLDEKLFIYVLGKIAS